MSNKINKDENSSESLHNATFKAIGQAHISNLIDDLNSEADSIKKVELSQAMNDWVKSLIGNSIVKKKESNLTIRKAAIYLIILLGAFSVTTLSVEAFRIKLYDYIIEVRQEFTRLYITRENTSEDPNLDIEHYYYPTRLPDGFSYDNTSEEHDIVTMTYTKGADEIIFIQSKARGDYQLDTEEATVTKVPIGELDGYLIVKDTRTMVIWNNDSYEFFLRGYTHPGELLKMAESLEKK